MKKVIGEIFYEENKRLKILMKIIRIPFLNNGISSNICEKESKKKCNIIEKVIVSAFDDKNNNLYTNLD